MFVHTRQRKFHHFVVLAGAQQDTNRRLVAFYHLVLFVVTDVAIELAQVLMPECVVLEFNEHMAFEDAVVEHQINKEVVAADEQALLPRLEAEAVAQFQQVVE